MVENRPNNRIDFLGMLSAKNLKTGDPCNVCCKDCRQEGKLKIRDNGTKGDCVKASVTGLKFKSIYIPTYKSKKGDTCCAADFVWWTCYTKECGEKHTEFQLDIKIPVDEGASGLSVLVARMKVCKCREGKWSCRTTPAGFQSKFLLYTWKKGPGNNDKTGWTQVNGPELPKK